VRVIAGRYRGRRLVTVRDLSVRPAADRVKQTLFDMLTVRMPLEGAEVLDLFAGSGSLGIEALSRGAARAVFVEGQREAAECIRANLAAIGCADRASVIVGDALRYCETDPASYDLVFADPPYVFAATPRLPGLLFGHGRVRPEGYLLIEHAEGLAFPPSPAYHEGPTKKFGRTIVTFFSHAAPPAGNAEHPSRPPAAQGDPR
jgi:16S rRNA (guanine966-N2)-methyltransferase